MCGMASQKRTESTLTVRWPLPDSSETGKLVKTVLGGYGDGGDVEMGPRDANGNRHAVSRSYLYWVDDLLHAQLCVTAMAGAAPDIDFRFRFSGEATVVSLGQLNHLATNLQLSSLVHEHGQRGRSRPYRLLKAAWGMKGVTFAGSLPVTGMGFEQRSLNFDVRDAETAIRLASVLVSVDVDETPMSLKISGDIQAPKSN